MGAILGRGKFNPPSMIKAIMLPPVEKTTQFCCLLCFASFSFLTYKSQCVNLDERHLGDVPFYFSKRPLAGTFDLNWKNGKERPLLSDKTDCFSFAFQIDLKSGKSKHNPVRADL
jgi:hypothetical protein